MATAMTSSEVSTAGKFTHRRPTDATGLLWAVVALLFGGFFTAMSHSFGLVLIAFPYCVFWQLRKWKDDRLSVKAAAEWCRAHYPAAGDTPVVDVVLSMSDNSATDISRWEPSTEIDSLNWLSEDDWHELYPECHSLSQAWIADVLNEAHVQHVDAGQIQGNTIHDVIGRGTIAK